MSTSDKSKKLFWTRFCRVLLIVLCLLPNTISFADIKVPVVLMLSINGASQVNEFYNASLESSKFEYGLGKGSTNLRINGAIYSNCDFDDPANLCGGLTHLYARIKPTTLSFQSGIKEIQVSFKGQISGKAVSVEPKPLNTFRRKDNSSAMPWQGDIKIIGDAQEVSKSMLQDEIHYSTSLTIQVIAP
jgi:hypothetical protein